MLDNQITNSHYPKADQQSWQVASLIMGVGKSFNA